MLTGTVYPIIWLILWGIFFVFFGLMILRLIFNYADPNPFGKVGRFGFRIRKLTERFVYPAARFFATYRFDTRLAPILTILRSLSKKARPLYVWEPIFSATERRNNLC